MAESQMPADLKQQVQKMIDAGAPREQIQAAVDAYKKKAEPPSLGERAARAVEGKGVPGAIRSGLAGAAKGAIEQVQHPFTFGGPQTEKLINENVPGGNYVTGALNTVASPGAAALAGGTGAAIRAVRPMAGRAMAAAPAVVQKGVQMAQQNPIATGAMLGGVHGGLTGGVKGAVSGAIEGAAGGGVYGKLGKIAKLAGVAEEAAGGAAAKTATKAAAAEAAPAAEKGATNIVKSAADFAAQDRQHKIAAMEASRRGMMNAAGMTMSPSERALLMKETGSIDSETLVKLGLGSGALLYGGKFLKDKLGKKIDTMNKKLNPYQRAADILDASGGSSAIK